MMKLRVTPHEKMLLELCVRLVLCELLEEEQSVIDEFSAGLFNLVNGNFGDQGLEEEIDPNNWVAQLEPLRSCLRKLETLEWRRLCIQTGAESYRLPQEEGIKPQ